MEKVNFQNSRGLNLVGDFYPADDDDRIVIMMHGFTGDRHEWGLFDRIAEELQVAGNSVLTFDFSGSGESDDDSLALDKQVEDFYAVVKYVKSRGFENIGLHGHSFGGLVALKGYSEDIAAMVLTAPVTNKVRYTWDKRYSAEQLAELREKGYITTLREEGVRKKFIIDKQMLKDREAVDPEEILPNVKCPVLILHGAEDERVPVDDSKEAINYLPLESELRIIPGANHKFEKYVDTIVGKTVLWFNKYL
ncbi:alpha/beta fold hydrolase [Candidatus Woesearchaeota archaeon]|nr:alpha/beta fold hydrolase [Candidatus Woesearchaeota archaeon]